MQKGDRVKYQYRTHGEGVGTIEDVTEGGSVKVLWDGEADAAWLDGDLLTKIEEDKPKDQVLSPGIHINESKIRG